MSWFGVGKVGLQMLLMAALVLAPGAAPALLVGDQVTAVLKDLDTSTNIISGTATVVDPGTPEFSGSFGFSDWTLDILDNGFVLAARCSSPDPDCAFASGVALSLSDLDFSPPSSLLGLASSSGDLTIDGSPLVTPSSITINFQGFLIATGGEFATLFEATFATEPRPAVPHPAAILLVLVGGLGLGALALRRARA